MTRPTRALRAIAAAALALAALGAWLARPDPTPATAPTPAVTWVRTAPDIP